jgi:quercetin 2,3-dioxygenase
MWSRRARASASIRADADVYFGKLDDGRQITYRSAPDYAQWVHVIHGEVFVAGETLKSGDGAAVENAESLEISSRAVAQFLLFDLK